MNCPAYTGCDEFPECGHVLADWGIELLNASQADLKPLAFSLTITLGNEGMLSGLDVADALSRAADRIPFEEVLLSGSGSIHDVNGNIVGEWGVK